MVLKFSNLAFYTPTALTLTLKGSGTVTKALADVSISGNNLTYNPTSGEKSTLGSGTVYAQVKVETATDYLKSEVLRMTADDLGKTLESEITLCEDFATEIALLRAEKVAKAGDTMTGVLISNRGNNDSAALIVKHNAQKGTLPGAAQNKYLSFLDNQSTTQNIGLLHNQISTAGYVYLLMSAYSFLGNGYSSIRIRQDPDGTGHPQFYQAADTILGVAATGPHEILHEGNYGSYALPLSGGTVRGQVNLTSNESAPFRIRHSFAKGSNPSSTEYRNIYINDSGSSANYLASLQSWVNANGLSAVQMTANQNVASGSGASGIRAVVTQAGDTYLYALVNSTTYDLHHDGNFSSKYDASNTFAYSFAGLSGNLYMRKRYKTVHLGFSIGGSPTASSITGGDAIGTLAEGWRPAIATYVPAIGRTSGTWASATYYPCSINISTAGVVQVVGNKTEMQACKYWTSNVVFDVA